VAREGQRFCYRCGHELRDYYDSLNIEIKDSRSDSNPLPASPSNDPAAGGEKAAPNMTAEFSSPQVPAASPATQAAGTVALNMEEVGTNTEPVIARHTSEQKAMLRILLPTGDVFDREVTQTETQMGNRAPGDASPYRRFARGGCHRRRLSQSK